MQYGKYGFKCCFESDAILPPYKGSTFRGIFGHALKKVVCALKRQECEDCLLKERCIYTLVFETKHAVKVPDGLRISTPPNPFVIEPPISNETMYKKGSSFDFNLLLFGNVNNSLAYFIYAFDQIGNTGIGKRIGENRGVFCLKEVKDNNGIIYSDKDRSLVKSEEAEELILKDHAGNDGSVFRIKLVLETPLRLKFENHLKADLPFHVLVRAMLRRISSLYTFYDNGEPPLDYRGLVERAKNIRIVEEDLSWFDWKRYSNRQDQKMLMGGIAGSITYEGRIAEYLHLIEFCEKVHIGKQTTFGLGKIGIEI
ncbi:MAG: CRISPR system precrRNA processing endoribonuclease RAMP protein Cas6 [Proteobacteria bacterium]|nr:CRISPR system precrRNA processing endoribonuclease RAMP protein Cas6 [Pseudomonadota bacterium]